MCAHVRRSIFNGSDELPPREIFLSVPSSPPSPSPSGPSEAEVAPQTLRLSTGLTKLGAIVGDKCQLGCHVTTDPGTLLAPSTVVYPLVHLRRGFHGPRVLITKEGPRPLHQHTK